MKSKDINRINMMYQEETIICMAEMFEYVENHLHIDLKEYFIYFNKTKISDYMFALDTKYILGKSSIEIVKEVLENNNIKYKIYDENKLFYPGDSYWTGMIVASYCFAKNISFKKFEKMIDINEIRKRFYPLHEAPHIKTIEVIDEIFSKKETNLAKCRVTAGYSQDALATISGVSLRSIQMYEQRNKDINKASFSTVKSLAKSLNVDMNDLYECANAGYEKLISMY